MVSVVELLEVILSTILSLLSPEKTAEKVNDGNTAKSAKVISITLFTVIYLSTLIGVVVSLFFISDILYRIFALLLIMFCYIVY